MNSKSFTRLMPRVVAAVVLGAVVACPQLARAIQPFFEQFQAKYVQKDSTDEKQKAWATQVQDAQKCFVCHVKGKEKKERNRYGMALAKLLNKKDFAPERMKADPEKAKQEIRAALDKVAVLNSDPADDKSPTFGELLFQTRLPGGDAPAAAVVAKVEPPKAEPAKPEPPKAEPAKPEPPKPEPAKTAPAPAPKPEAPAPVAIAPPRPKHVETPEEKEAIAKVMAIGGSVRDVAMNDDSKDVDFHLGGTGLTDAGLVYLKAIPNIVSLSLKETQITDAGLANIAELTSLTRLHLEKTKVTDAGLAHLKNLANLEYLNLYGTEVTDAGLEQLKGLPKLRKLFVWQSKVTDQGATKLKEALPQVDISLR